MLENPDDIKLLKKLLKKHKYRAVKTVVDNIKFDSKREAERYCELRMLLRGHHISNLHCHVPYQIVVNGMPICAYIADFVYMTDLHVGASGGRKVVEDVKGVRTPAYRLKKKLMMAIYGIDIHEVK